MKATHQQLIHIYRGMNYLIKEIHPKGEITIMESITHRAIITGSKVVRIKK